MTTRFANHRLVGYAFLIIFALVVLGLSASLASTFLPNYHHDFIIMALVASSVTILSCIILFQWSQPRIEVVVLFLVGVFWIVIGATASDMIGQTECYSLGNQQTPSKNGSTSARSYCYEMKVIEAFAWALFVLYTIFFWIVITLTSRAVGMGLPMAWREPIITLPWFSEASPNSNSNPYAYGGLNNGGGGGYPFQQQPQMMGSGYPGAGANAVQQQPGHSVVIQPGYRGMPTTVRQVPSGPGPNVV